MYVRALWYYNIMRREMRLIGKTVPGARALFLRSRCPGVRILTWCDSGVGSWVHGEAVGVARQSRSCSLANEIVSSPVVPEVWSRRRVMVPMRKFGGPVGRLLVVQFKLASRCNASLGGKGEGYVWRGYVESICGRWWFGKRVASVGQAGDVVVQLSSV